MAEAAKQITMSAEEFERFKAEFKTEVTRDIITALRSELAKMSPVPANDDTLMTTAEAAAYCGFKRRDSFLMHVSRGHLKPDVYGQRGRFGMHRFKKSTLDRFMTGKDKS